nr:EOG090X07KN [Cyclestheria hislopi]
MRRNDRWEGHVKKISQALLQYKPCQLKNCSCYTDMITNDLIIFKDGITEELIHKANERGIKYQIIKHRLYRERDCMFPSRCSGIEHFVLKIIRDLPDMELIINTRDWAQISRHFGAPLPVFSFSKTKDYYDITYPAWTFWEVFSFSKTKDYYDITYPAWTFWEGGPAISLYPKGLGRWDLHRVSIKKAADSNPWEKKLTKGFFRGSRTSSERDPLILLSRKEPSLIDAQYTKNQAWKSKEDTLGATPAAEVSFEEHCKYKYLFNYRGVAASFRFKHLFLCRSLVFHVGDEWIEFFYSALKPWVHYIPVSSAATEKDIRELVEFAQQNDELVHGIADRGYELIWEHLEMKDVECYWKTLLLQYSQLLRYQPVLDKRLILIG